MKPPTIRTAYDFEPERDAASLPVLIPACASAKFQPAENKLEIHLPGDVRLSGQDLGRLMIVQGKCRSQGIQLILRASITVRNQLEKCGLDRIIWTEPVDSKSA